MTPIMIRSICRHCVPSTQTAVNSAVTLDYFIYSQSIYWTDDVLSVDKIHAVVWRLISISKNLYKIMLQIMQ
ncbi:hypothetical protein T02_633 [Trichinella nativa]|uniref:Uncharacterized protein n=1 Tax=Trichinella nativa TaxID=6335 RepID=A0A0V1LEN2_9BILA|nr:hypothetical protein T02_633 [Trichinella nativa]